MSLKHLMIAATVLGGLVATAAPADAARRDPGWYRHHGYHRVCKRERHHHRWVRRCYWRHR